MIGVDILIVLEKKKYDGLKYKIHLCIYIVLFTFVQSVLTTNVGLSSRCVSNQLVTRIFLFNLSFLVQNREFAHIRVSCHKGPIIMNGTFCHICADSINILNRIRIKKK
jgi:hypothetical protein